MGIDITNLNRRGFLGLTGLVATSAALAACAGTGDGSGGSSGASGSAASGDVSTINFWSNHPGKSIEIEKELIGRFQAQNPDLTVNLIDGGKNYEEVSQKFNAALSGGDLPDVVVLSDVWWFNYAITGAIAPLDDLFSTVGVDTGDYVDSLLADYLYEGSHFALPYARSTPLFYYNKDVWTRPACPTAGPSRGRSSTSGDRASRKSSAAENGRTAGAMQRTTSAGLSKARSGPSAVRTPTAGI